MTGETGGHSFEVKGGERREQFVTGSQRDTREGKGRFDLLSPIALRRLALVYEAGASRYGPRNWEKGQPLSRYMDSAARHLFAWLGGDRSEDHMAQCAWNCFAYIHTEAEIRAGRLPAELDDMPPGELLDDATCDLVGHRLLAPAGIHRFDRAPGELHNESAGARGLGV